MTIIQQTSLDQTGIAIYELSNGEEKQIPLFSLEPCKEARELATYMGCEKASHVYITNNLCEYRIEDEIRNYKKEHNGAVPEEFMDQLASGFPFIEGREPVFLMSCYA